MHSRKRRGLLCGSNRLHAVAEARTCGAQRVAQRDGAAIGVDLGAVQTQHVAAEGGLARKRLVELEQVDVVDGEARLLQRCRDCDLRLHRESSQRLTLQRLSAG